MASTPKQVNGTSTTKTTNNNANNGVLGKRKKSRSSKGSYLSKWLDKTMSHMRESAPSPDNYETYIAAHLNWPHNSQFAPGFDPYRYHMYGPEPTSLPTLPTYYNPMPYYLPESRYVQSVNQSVQVQRPRRRRSENKAEGVHSAATPNSTIDNYFQPKTFTDSQDFASLPPVVTSVADTNSNSEANTNEKNDNTSTRRFSDPCVRGLPDVAQPANGDMESGSEASSDLSGSQIESRLLPCLLDQIASLKMVNERLNKELVDTKAELERVRQHIYHNASSPSLGATPNHTPLNGNGMLNGQYPPGILTDLVREIRDAARVREEAMYARVRAMVLERNDSSLGSIDAKSLEKSLEDIKSTLRASEADKRRMMDRLAKLEDELRIMKLSSGNAGTASLESKLTNGSADDIDAERVRLRKDLADAKKAKQHAEDHALKLERLVTQLRSKFNGIQLTNGPDSLTSEPEHEPNVRARRSSANSSTSTVVFGPVTDL